jgi:hypothetical protein
MLVHSLERKRMNRGALESFADGVEDGDATCWLFLVWPGHEWYENWTDVYPAIPTQK